MLQLSPILLRHSLYRPIIRSITPLIPLCHNFSTARNRNHLKMGDARRPNAPPPPLNETSGYIPRYIDIGINLADPVFRGIHKDREGKDKIVHKDDHVAVIERAIKSGCQIMIVTGSSLESSREAIGLAREFPGKIYATVGIHPCSSLEIENDPSVLDQIETLALESKSSNLALAFGEIGLDYDRLYHASKEIQLEQFKAQLQIARKLDLPLFLHSRAAHDDFVRLLKENDIPRRGVVHSFTGTSGEMRELVEMGYEIGINGCSLKTVENCEVVRELDLGRLHLETDGPWCEIRPTHESSRYLDGWKEEWVWRKKEKWSEGDLVKGRNEPCCIGKVARAVAGIKGVGVEEVCEAAWRNSRRLFGLDREDGGKGTGGES